jgi:hypothetical protein
MISVQTLRVCQRWEIGTVPLSGAGFSRIMLWNATGFGGITVALQILD